ncbi:Receptor-like serine/threonine-protein kinase ALE2 [Platanthera zijinensis]|uniref:Receptor-like serine/threonine-protein kinase ALE2 n=1 Tax=Platanthera zijinensis TaxID=2320716 RepID=A0AAP0GAG3_9ASPA
MGNLGADYKGVEGDGAIARVADEKVERETGKTIVLGIRADSKGRELLTWALVNVAVSGDSVVAVHVLRFSSPPADYTDEFEPIRKAYEGFCSLRRINLAIKICKGFSVRRALVRLVTSHCASHLILGEAKSSAAIRSSLNSIPKYCAKKLPPECSVVAVNNGKIVFGRGAVGRREAAGYGKISSFFLNLRKGIRGETLDCLLEIEGQKCSIVDVNKSTARSEDFPCSTGTDPQLNSIVDQLLEEKCSVGGETVSGTHCCPKEMIDKSMHESIADAPISLNSSVALGLEEPTNVGLSRSILRRTTLAHRRTISMDGSRISLIQWAKWFSGRSSSSSENHFVGKHRRYDTFAACNIRKRENLSPLHLDEANFRIKLKSLQEKYSSSCKLFSHVELMRATSNFSPERLIGKGGSSLVFKGIFPDGKELAIKTLKPSKDSLQQFLSEIDVLDTLNHENIVSLLGFCLENNSFALIYDFFPRGSLEENLHRSKEHSFLFHWNDRYRISIGVAEALSYLHGCQATESVIHMDVKSSNILLSDDFVPKLSDFGLARRPTESISHISCNNLTGTFGYLAPEYFMFGQISTKTDVYAFGVVLLELLSGRKPISSGGIKGAQSLVMWANPMLQNGKARELVDQNLGGKYDVNQMERMVLAASLCLKRDSQSRPTMLFVLQLLHGDEDSVKSAKLQVDSLENRTNLEDEDLCMIANIKSCHNSHRLDFEDDSPSESSNEHMTSFTTDAASLEDSLQGRFSSSSSLD